MRVMTTPGVGHAARSSSRRPILFFCHMDTSSTYYTIAIAIEPTVCEEVAAAIMLVLTTLDLLLAGETAIGMK